MIRLDAIEPDPDQPRKKVDQAHIRELAASIKKLGVLQPISVRYVKHTDRYRIIAGECRYRACLQTGLTEIPCWVRTPEENQILLSQVIENWQRSDLNPFELADSLSILKEANGFTQKQLAESTGKSPGEISKLLSILELSPSVQAVVRQADTHTISKRHLYALSRIAADRQEAVLHRIEREMLGARDVERIAEREERERETGDRRGRRQFRRSFKTSRCQVSFSFWTDTIGDEDVLQALHEIRRQIGEA